MPCNQVMIIYKEIQVIMSTHRFSDKTYLNVTNEIGTPKQVTALLTANAKNKINAWLVILLPN